jgi:hypothetical protein
MYNWWIPKKKVLESWGNLWIFSKSSFGCLCRQCLFFCAKLVNFRKKRRKRTSDDLYKSLIILLYSWLHTKGKKKRFWQIFTILFSLVTIENLLKHLNLEFLTFNFIFWWNFARKKRPPPSCTYETFDANQSFHVIQPHATSIIIFFL